MASGHVNRIKRPNTWLHRPQACNVKILLANSEPSTHGPMLSRRGQEDFLADDLAHSLPAAFGGKADIDSPAHSATIQPWDSTSARWRISAGRLPKRRPRSAASNSLATIWSKATDFRYLVH